YSVGNGVPFSSLGLVWITAGCPSGHRAAIARIARGALPSCCRTTSTSAAVTASTGSPLAASLLLSANLRCRRGTRDCCCGGGTTAAVAAHHPLSHPRRD